MLSTVNAVVGGLCFSPHVSAALGVFSANRVPFTSGFDLQLLHVNCLGIFHGHNFCFFINTQRQEMLTLCFFFLPFTVTGGETNQMFTI